VSATGSFHGTISGVPALRIAQDPAADELLGRDPLALLIGMLLDQHVSRGAVGTRASGAGSVALLRSAV
jgi:hypothetical protein